MRVIIVGCGKVGTTIAEQLSKEGHDIVIIDINSEILQHAANNLDVMGIVGNGASYAIQMDAGIEDTDLVIAVTDSDELNLLCCLIAKKAGNCSTIARVRNPIYNNEINFIKEELGLSMAINPEFTAAAEISRMLSFPAAIKIDTFDKGKVEILKFKIESHSVLNNVKLMEIKKKFNTNILICAVERGTDVIIPKGSFVLQENDIISIVASTVMATAFFKKIGEEVYHVKNTIIAGGGTIAYYLAKSLIEVGVDVKIVERDKIQCEKLSELLPKAIIINGDATDQDVLLEEGLEFAESFVSLTGFDETNILLSLFAKSVSKGKIVTKVNRISFNDIINNFNLGSIVYPKFITAESITQYVRAMQNSIGINVETLYKIIENRAEALEFFVKKGTSIVGVPIEKLKIKPDIIIACISHKGKIIIPGGKDIIRIGDKVIIVTTIVGINDIEDILIHFNDIPKLERGIK